MFGVCFMCDALSSVLCTMFMIMILLRCLGRTGGRGDIPCLLSVVGLSVFYYILVCVSLILVLAIHVFVSLLASPRCCRSLLLFCRLIYRSLFGFFFMIGMIDCTTCFSLLTLFCFSDVSVDLHPGCIIALR